MDKDEQAPNTPPETPEVEKTEPAEAAPEIKIVEEPKPEVSSDSANTSAETTVKPTDIKVESTNSVDNDAPLEQTVEAAPAENNVAAEMDRLLNDEAAASPTPEPQLVMGKKHNHVVIIIILSLLVLAAVGFAIFEYITAQNIKCDCPKCETTECKCGEKEEEEKVSSRDYIYIGDFGIKIKKPENWKSSVSVYAFYNSSQTVETFEIREISESDIQPNIMISPRTTACEKLSTNLDAENLDTEAELDAGSTCIEIDDIYIDVFANNGVSDALKTHFNDNENYSKI